MQLPHFLHRCGMPSCLHCAMGARSVRLVAAGLEVFVISAGIMKPAPLPLPSVPFDRSCEATRNVRATEFFYFSGRHEYVHLLPNNRRRTGFPNNLPQRMVCLLLKQYLPWCLSLCSVRCTNSMCMMCGGKIYGGRGRSSIAVVLVLSSLWSFFM